MSQVMETPQVLGPAPNNRLVESLSTEQQQGFDILKVLWRWKWLPVLGAMIGTGLGYLYFSKQPAQYQAAALVQVVDSLPPTRMDHYDPNEAAKITRTDESMVIKSQKVLRLSVEKGRLNEQPALRGKSVDLIAGMLSGKELVVQPADKTGNTTLISISYTCNDAELAAAVVNAVVEGYDAYVSEDSRTNTNKIYDIVTKAQESLSNSYKTLNEKYTLLKRNAPNVVTGDESYDLYAENFKAISNEILNLKSKQKVLQGTLKQVNSAVQAGRSPESILLFLSHEYKQPNADHIISAQSQQQPRAMFPPVELRTDTESAKLERTELVQLQMRERQLADEVAENHPSLAKLRQRITMLQEHIAKLHETEKAFQAEEERIRKAFEEEAKKEVVVEGLSVEQRLEMRIESLKEEHDAITEQIAGLEVLAGEQEKKSKEYQAATEGSRLLNMEISSVQKMLDGYTEMLKQIELIPQAGQRTLKTLNLPSTGYFYGPKLSPYLLGGAALGFLVLSGLAVLMDLADRSYRNPDEIAQDLSMPVLGHIPIMEIGKVKKVIEAADASLTTLHHSRGRVSEAYRAVRTGLFFSNRGSDLKVIQITSPVPGDGKSTLSSNLAVTMAQSGRRVLLIDADFRRPRIAKIFGIDADVGMAAVVADKAELDDAIYASPVANLSIMPGGKRPSNPAELLSSRRFAELVDILRGKFDIIIIDTPPLLAVSVDGVVLTMRLRRNVKPLATRATRILESVDARLLGVVVNGVSAEAGYGYSYGYNDYRYAYRYGSNYRYGYGSKYGYGGRYGSYASGYIEEPHDVEQGPPPPKDPQV
jgi:polysaccharide biosynthesis transport protein